MDQRQQVSARRGGPECRVDVEQMGQQRIEEEIGKLRVVLRSSMLNLSFEPVPIISSLISGLPSVHLHAAAFAIDLVRGRRTVIGDARWLRTCR